MNKTRIIILIISLSFISFSLGASYFLYQRSRSSTADEVVKEDFQVPIYKPQLSTSTASQKTTTTVALSQDYLKIVQKTANDFNKISKVNSAIGQLLLKIQESLEEEETDEIPDLINQIKNQNLDLFKSILVFKDSISQWESANKPPVNEKAIAKAAELIAIGNNFSKSAENYSGTINNILKGNSLLEWQINFLKYNNQFKESVLEMSKNQKAFISSFNEFKNLIGAVDKLE